MKYFDWNEDKNHFLKTSRDISFEEIIIEIQSGNLIDRLKHPNKEKYPNQYILYVKREKYIYAVPCVEDEKKIFLKTIIPDRKATRKYLGDKK